MNKTKTPALLDLTTLTSLLKERNANKLRFDSRPFLLFFREKQAEISKKRRQYYSFIAGIVITTVLALAGLIFFEKTEEGFYGLVLAVSFILLFLIQGRFPKLERKKYSRTEFQKELLSQVERELGLMQEDEIVSAILLKLKALPLKSKVGRLKEVAEFLFDSGDCISPQNYHRLIAEVQRHSSLTPSTAKTLQKKEEKVKVKKIMEVEEGILTT